MNEAEDSDLFEAHGLAHLFFLLWELMLSGLMVIKRLSSTNFILIIHDQIRILWLYFLKITVFNISTIIIHQDVRD